LEVSCAVFTHVHVGQLNLCADQQKRLLGWRHTWFVHLYTL